jgi:HAD superfamily hydrolase (TIGR01549 family)
MRTILFDLDDTLFDHEHSSRCGLSAVYSRYPCFASKTFNEFEKNASDEFEVLWFNVLRGEMSIEAWQTETFRRLFNLYDTPCDTNAAAYYRATYQQSRQPIVGAMKLLEFLNPVVKIGIITNHLTEEQRGKLKCCQLDHLIDFLVCADEVGVPKPDRRIFEFALQSANCEPHNAVMIGDSWTSDVLGASALGIQAVWFNRHGIPCPDPSFAKQITSLEPTQVIGQMLISLV